MRPHTTINFSMNNSESRTAIWAARPINELAVELSAWWTSNRTSLHLFFMTGCSRLLAISLYAAPEKKKKVWKKASKMRFTYRKRMHHWQQQCTVQYEQNEGAHSCPELIHKAGCSGNVRDPVPDSICISSIGGDPRCPSSRAAAGKLTSSISGIPIDLRIYGAINVTKGTSIELRAELKSTVNFLIVMPHPC